MQNCIKKNDMGVYNTFIDVELSSHFLYKYLGTYRSMASCQKGPNSHAYAWQIGPFRQDALDI